MGYRKLTIKYVHEELSVVIRALTQFAQLLADLFLAILIAGGLRFLHLGHEGVDLLEREVLLGPGVDDGLDQSAGVLTLLLGQVDLAEQVQDLGLAGQLPALAHRCHRDYWLALGPGDLGHQQRRQ